jgi:predicted DNA-binding transcriptional regulator AlpA
MSSNHQDTVRVFLNSQQLADLFGVPKSTIDHWRAAGTGPNFSRLGKHVRYRESDCLEWADENRNATR